jgi:hypothetical protein
MVAYFGVCYLLSAVLFYLHLDSSPQPHPFLPSATRTGVRDSGADGYSYPCEAGDAMMGRVATSPSFFLTSFYKNCRGERALPFSLLLPPAKGEGAGQV